METALDAQLSSEDCAECKLAATDRRRRSLYDLNFFAISENLELVRVEGLELVRSEGWELVRSEDLELGKSEDLKLVRSEGSELVKSEGLELGRSEDLRSESLSVLPSRLSWRALFASLRVS